MGAGARVAGVVAGAERVLELHLDFVDSPTRILLSRKLLEKLPDNFIEPESGVLIQHLHLQIVGLLIQFLVHLFLKRREICTLDLQFLLNGV